MKDAKDEPVYVGFQDSAALRRSVLEAARTSVTSQKAHQRLIQIQDQKLSTRTELAKTLKELRDELSKLQMVLPHREVKDIPLSAAQGAALGSQNGKKKVSESKADKIEAALAEIEQRMRSL